MVHSLPKYRRATKSIVSLEKQLAERRARDLRQAATDQAAERSKMPISQKYRELARTNFDQAVALACSERGPVEQLALERQIAQEIEEGRRRNPMFTPDAWAQWRRLGYTPEEIEYDMSHAVR